jgi:twitching motility protein PilJ
MMVIQDITTNTALGTEKTADSIGKLADLADELKGSVAGFKLPE